MWEWGGKALNLMFQVEVMGKYEWCGQGQGDIEKLC